MATPQMTISFADINRELELSLNLQLGLGDSNPRYLCGILQGSISMNDLKNKRYKSNRMRIGSHSVGGGNNSGGVFDIRSKIFYNKYNCVTHVLFDASKYEKALFIFHFNREWSGANIWHTLPSDWKSEHDSRVRIPGSADWHTSYYDGYKLFPDGVGK